MIYKDCCALYLRFVVPDQPFYSDERASMRQARRMTGMEAGVWGLWLGSVLVGLLFLVPAGIFFYHALAASHDPVHSPLALYLLGVKALVIGLTLSTLLARRALRSMRRRSMGAAPAIDLPS